MTLAPATPDLTHGCDAAVLRAQAAHCRRLAQAMTDRQTIEALLAIALEYDARAVALNGAAPR